MSMLKRIMSSGSKSKSNNSNGDGDEHDQNATITSSISSSNNSRRRPPLAPEQLHVSQQQLLEQQQQHQQQQHRDRDGPPVPTAQLTSLQARRSLHRKLPSLSTYQTTPITKHYELSDQILAAFESHYTQKVYRIAYAIGLQFVETALIEIPKHGYFYSSRHERERMQSSLDAVRVTHLLQEMQQDESQLGRMDIPLADQMRVETLAGLAVAQVRQASEDQYESQRAKAERELRGDSLNTIAGAATTTAAAADMTPSQHQHYQQQQQQQQKRQHYRYPDEQQRQQQHGVGVISSTPTPQLSSESAPVIPSSPRGAAGGAVIQSPPLLLRNDALENDIDLLNDADPTVMAMRTDANESRQYYSDYDYDPEVSYQYLNLEGANHLNFFPTTVDHVQSSEDLLLEKALYLSGLEVTPAVSMDISDHNERVPPPPSTSNNYLSDSFSHIMAMDLSNHNLSALDQQQQQHLQWTTVARFYHEDFDHLRHSGRVRVSYANTYQGRLPESTNGCTVIAPLLCIHHLLNDDCIPDPGLPDAVIEAVIDAETPSILSEVRRKHGLSAQAFLIPSDAHDYLIENGQLSQEQFITVTGGNILDESHLKAFTNALERADRRKVAACLFFHEHVVAILKVRRDEKCDIPCWYDLIDGLPLKETYAWVGESDTQMSNRLHLTDSQEMEMDVFLPKTARVRCLNAEALIACLRWYACSKFTADNVSYIDQYPWDDNSCDFDPRVFQGFVWGSYD